MKILDFGHNVLGLTYSPLQEVILQAARGEALSASGAELYERYAGRPWPGPGEPPMELDAICGRQSGKTGYLAPTLILHAALDPATVEGLEPGYVRDLLLVAPTVRQARIAYTRLLGLIRHRPELARYVLGEPTQHEIEFTFGVRIGVWAARGANMRGTQARLLLLDEGCFLPAEGSRADFEIIESILPGMACVPNGQIIAISSPWVQQGYLYENWRRRAELRDTVVFQAASWELNPRISQKFLERQRERDEEYFRREFGAEFLTSISAFLPTASVDACCVRGREVVPPRPGVRYMAAIDQGYKADTWVLGIGHQDNGRIVVDRLRGWKPGKGAPVRLETLLPELDAELKPYGIRCVMGDQFGAVAFRELLRGRGLEYEERTFTNESKRDMYGSLKVAVTSEAIELLDHAESLRELRTLESRVTPAGNVKIEAPHTSGFSDDYADTLAILVHELRPSSVYAPRISGAYDLMMLTMAEKESAKAAGVSVEEWRVKQKQSAAQAATVPT